MTALLSAQSANSAKNPRFRQCPARANVSLAPYASPVFSVSDGFIPYIIHAQTVVRDGNSQSHESHFVKIRASGEGGGYVWRGSGQLLAECWLVSYKRRKKCIYSAIMLKFACLLTFTIMEKENLIICANCGNEIDVNNVTPVLNRL
jgi:hypothetical protein